MRQCAGRRSHAIADRGCIRGSALATVRYASRSGMRPFRQKASSHGTDNRFAALISPTML